MSSGAPNTSWTRHPERGSQFLLSVMVWIGLHLGRGVARLLLHPITFYFVLFSPTACRASRAYLSRALSRPATWRDTYRHIHTFAATILDRIYLLNDQIDKFDIQVHHKADVLDANTQTEGLLMLGAHMGSFEALRVVGHNSTYTPPVALLMYEGNAQMLTRLLEAINPAAAHEIIALGKVNSMLEVKTRLAQGTIIGMLADRTLQDDEARWLPFLGAPAPFPLGPFRLAALLRRPLVLMLGLYHGENRYEVHFEALHDFSQPGLNRQDAIEQAIAKYAARLEQHCRNAPYNWFNFYDFWSSDHASR